MSDVQRAETTAENNTKTGNSAPPGKSPTALIGDIVSLFMRTPAYKNVTLDDLNWLLLPPLALNQFRIAEVRDKETNRLIPIGMVLWAKVSDEIDQALTNSNGDILKLSQKDWNSGDNIWLIEAIGDGTVISALMQNLRTTAFAGQYVKLRVRNQGGSYSVRILSDNPASERKSA